MHTPPAPTRRPTGRLEAVPLIHSPRKRYRVTLLEVWRETALIEASSPSDARRRAEEGHAEPLHGEQLALCVESVTELTECAAAGERQQAAARLHAELGEEGSAQ